MPTTRSMVSPANSSARASTAKRNPSTSPSSGATSRNRIPGWGKSGISRTSPCSDATSTGLKRPASGGPPREVRGPLTPLLGLPGPGGDGAGGGGGARWGAGGRATGRGRTTLAALRGLALDGGRHRGRHLARVGEAGLTLLQPHHHRGGDEDRRVRPAGQAHEQGDGEVLEGLGAEQTGADQQQRADRQDRAQGRVHRPH